MVTFGEGLAGSTFLTKHQTTSQTPWAESQWALAMGSAAIVYIRKPTASSVITSRRTKKSGPQSPSNTPSIIHQNIRTPFFCDARVGAALWLRSMAVGVVRLPRERGANLALGIHKVLREF